VQSCQSESDCSMDATFLWCSHVFLLYQWLLAQLDALTHRHTSLRKRKLQIWSVCPYLSIKPPLAATWLGVLGSTVVDVAGGWQHSVFSSIYTFFISLSLTLSLYVCVCALNLSMVTEAVNRRHKAKFRYAVHLWFTKNRYETLFSFSRRFCLCAWTET